MPSGYQSLFAWARRTSTSFTELLSSGHAEEADGPPPDGIAYRLKQWPQLAPRQKTAALLQTLSVMSSRPVNRNWILANAKLPPEQLDPLLQRLIEQGAIEAIDTSRFGRPRFDDPTA